MITAKNKFVFEKLRNWFGEVAIEITMHRNIQTESTTSQQKSVIRCV